MKKLTIALCIAFALSSNAGIISVAERNLHEQNFTKSKKLFDKTGKLIFLNEEDFEINGIRPHAVAAVMNKEQKCDMIIAKYDEGDFSKIQEVIARKFKRVAEINDTLYHSENNFVSITHDHIGGTNLGIEIKEENKRIFNNHREKYSQQVETKYNLNDLILEIGREEYGPMEVVKIMHSNRSEDREKVKKWLEIAKRRINAVVSK